MAEALAGILDILPAILPLALLPTIINLINQILKGETPDISTILNAVLPIVMVSAVIGVVTKLISKLAPAS
jgi:uncharacterized membrane protein